MAMNVEQNLEELSVEELKDKLLEYKVGDKIGLQSFSDADPREMDDFSVRIGVFGPAGSGKSSLINTVSKVLGSEVDEVAIAQSAGGEGTKLLEECTFGQFSMFDTRGFMDVSSELQETEFFRILYGNLRPGEEIDRGFMGELKTMSVGIGASKLNKPPLKRQLHVALWVIKADDVKFIKGKYQKQLDFILHRLKREAITMVTVITHADVIDAMPEASQMRKEAIKRAREATRCLPCHTFVLENWHENCKEFKEEKAKQILTMMHRALQCAESSIKTRQTKRRQEELEATKSCGGRLPSESEEKQPPLNISYAYNNL